MLIISPTFPRRRMLRDFNISENFLTHLKSYSTQSLHPLTQLLEIRSHKVGINLKTNNKVTIIIKKRFNFGNSSRKLNISKKKKGMKNYNNIIKMFKLILILNLLVSCNGFSQKPLLPTFKITQANGIVYTAQQVEAGKPLLIVYFSPSHGL